MSIMDMVIQHIKISGKTVLAPAEIATAEGCPELPIQRALGILENRGVVKAIVGSGGKYAVIAKPKNKQVRQREKVLGRDKMWRIIRARKRFTRIDVKRITGLPITSVEAYVKILLQHGYLRKIGKDGKADIFMLIKNPGPKRPILQKGGGKR